MRWASPTAFRFRLHLGLPPAMATELDLGRHRELAIVPAPPVCPVIVDLSRQRTDSALRTRFCFPLCLAREIVGWVVFDPCQLMVTETESEFRQASIVDFSAARLSPFVPGSICLLPSLPASFSTVPL